MKRVLFLSTVFCALTANAQSYLITFTGSGDATTVSTVKVENLTKGTSIPPINGSDILSLTLATAVNYLDDNQSTELKIYPNPMTDYSTMEIFPPVPGDAIITVCDITGKQIAQTNSYLENFRQAFRLSGIKNGFYLVNIKGNNYRFSGKLLSNGKSNGTISIEKVNSITQLIDEKAAKTDSKGTQATIDMVYSTGDRLKFTGTSGNFSTVVMDVPVATKTINFDFVACTDGDNNNYPVVKIGTQVWMAENLKTSKYNNGTLIPLVELNSVWANLRAPGYCWYNNDEDTYKAIYGALYSWYTVAGNLCPAGWHVPSDAEWTTLTLNTGGVGEAGKKLKETGNIHWINNDPGTTNESGFTALPGGFRSFGGPFNSLGTHGYWWASTEHSDSEGNFRGLDGTDNVNGATNGSLIKWSGNSVRCLKNY